MKITNKVYQVMKRNMNKRIQKRIEAGEKLEKVEKD